MSIFCSKESRPAIKYVGKGCMSRAGSQGAAWFWVITGVTENGIPRMEHSTQTAESSRPWESKHGEDQSRRCCASGAGRPGG